MSKDPAAAESLTSPKPQRGTGCAILFGLAFGAFGLVFTVMFLLLPLWRVAQAQGWRETPCTILESRVDVHSDSDGSTYRVAVRYSYLAPPPTPGAAEGQEMTGDRYDFATGHSSGREAKDAAVRANPPGLRRTCWVDPAHPERSVLERGFPTGLWIGLVTLIFPLAGFGIAFGVWRGSRRAAIPAGPLSVTATAIAAPVPAAASESLVPVPGSQRWAAPVVLLIFGGAWNAFVWYAFLHERSTIMRLFLIPFLAVGLGLAVGFAWTLLRTCNPRLRLRLERADLRPGGGGELSWEVDGQAQRLRQLTLALELREEASYTRGTDTVRDQHVWHRCVLAEREGGLDLLAGRAVFALPADLPPTFHAANNHLRWVVSVRSSIPWWPDVDDAWELLVMPAVRQPPALPADPPAETEYPPLPISLSAQRGADGTVVGTAAWDLPTPQRTLEVRLFWYTSGRGTRDVGVAAVKRLEGTAGRCGFAFALPDHPPTTAGTLVAIRWAVELVAEPLGKVARVELDP